jgi:VanZ family protein
MSSTTRSSEAGELRFGLWYWGLGVLALGLGLLVALQPASRLAPFDLNDKLLHGLAFTLFMLWFGALRRQRGVWQVAVALCVYGLGIELLQAMTTYRQADPLDFVADLCGVLLGWVLGWAGLRRWPEILERWLARP